MGRTIHGYVTSHITRQGWTRHVGTVEMLENGEVVRCDASEEYAEIATAEAFIEQYPLDAKTLGARR